MPRNLAAVASGVLLWGFLPLVPAPAVADAEIAECARYAVHGVAPGLRPADVRARMGPRGTVESVPGASGPQTGVTYATGDVPVYVLYDRDIAKDPEARVVLVRARARTGDVNPADFVRSIVPGLGEPVRGREHLEDGLRDGETVWEDGACGVEVTAYRKQADWWQPGHDYLFVQIESRHVADTAASPGPAAPPLPPPAAAAEAPAAAPTEPPQEPVVAPEAAAAPDSASKSEEPAVGPTRIASSYVPPVYPERARRLSITASVVLQVQVKSDGGVGDVEVRKCTRIGMGFEQAAVDAVKQWRYRPATRGGQPADAVITVRLDFQ